MWRKTLFLPLMAAAIGGPMLMLSGDRNKETSKSIDELEAELNQTSADAAAGQQYHPVSLDEIFNFGLNPGIVENRWKGVTKSQVNGQKIYRVSLLSGYGPHDLAGALTYEFNLNGAVKQIRFSGYVGDPSYILQFVTQRFGFAPKQGNPYAYHPTAFAGYDGSLQITRTEQYQNQLRLDLVISR